MKRSPYEIAELIRKYLLETSSADEERILEEWLQEDEMNRNILESFRDGDGISQEFDTLDRIDMEDAWQSIERKKTTEKLVWWRKWLPYAAAVLLIGSLYIIRYSNDSPLPQHEKASDFVGSAIPAANQKGILKLAGGQKISLGNRNRIHSRGALIKDEDGNVKYETTGNFGDEDVFNELIVPKGGIYGITLEDGTQVWLNAGSVLRFPVHFSNHERRVFLEGEAYFSVAVQKDRPFLVNAKGTEIQALGTAFNVNAYRNDPKTTLTKGSVKVRLNKEERILMPGYEASVKNGQLEVNAADIEKVLAWRNGYFHFNKETIREINEELARWYDLDIIYQGQIPARNFSGTIKRNVSLPEACRILGILTHMDYQVVGNQLTVKPERRKSIED